MTLFSAILIFACLAVVIGVAGTYLTRMGDRIADQTGFGEAMVGGLLLGAVSSLSGVVTSVTAAAGGHANLSFSNAVGGIAAQTVFLAIADLTYRKANLEHASASLPNLMQGVLLIILLTFVILTMVGPVIVIGQVHPASVALIVMYLLGGWVIVRAHSDPMWKPRLTSETVPDLVKPENLRKEHTALTVLRFLMLAGIVGVAGYFVAQTAVVIAEKTLLTHSFVGALFTSVATSLPELVIAIVAVRMGALTLAVGNIIGGNTFDVLFLAFSDMAYGEGSLYHHVGPAQVFMLALAILLSGILLMGMLHRQKIGLARSGWESIALIAVFLAGYVVLYFF